VDVDPAELVVVRGSAWTVVDRTPHDGCVAVRLRGAQPHNSGELRTLLSPFDRLRPVASSPAWRVRRPRAWLHAVRHAALDCHPYGGLRSAPTSRIDILPYQLEPAIAVVAHGVTRVLVADDVGLGKTIQAGLIVSELAVHSGGLRALVVTPASLRNQWREELLAHFDIEAVPADAAWLAAMSRSIPADVNPWALPGTYVVSFDFIKRAEVLRPLEDVTWDLLVVDEAHAAGPATDRRAAVDAIGARSRRVVLLTATPHGGDPAQFASLCAIGEHAGAASHGEQRPIVLFRRTRADAAVETRRRTVVLPVRPSRAERRMHRLLERYADRVRAEAGRDENGGVLAAIVLRKRALSSAGSLLASAGRRAGLLSGAAPPQPAQLSLPLGDEDPLDDDAPLAALSAPGLRDAQLEQRLLGAIVRAAAAASVRETKTACLLRLLRRLREPVIVFTEYRDTLARLAAAIEVAGHRPLLLHGGLAAEERRETQRTFNDAGGLLLATDAASEGLNLHHRCRIAVHYELPWRPLRLQQRAGRVDRIGQRRTVHEILLVAADTAERLVLAPLVRRAARARCTTSGASALFDSLTESRVAAAVLDGEEVDDDTPPPAAPSPVATVDLRQDAAREAARLIEQRAWRRSASASVRAGRIVTALRGRRTNAAICFFRFSMMTAAGYIAHSELIPVRLELNERGALKTHAEIRAAANRVVLASARALEIVQQRHAPTLTAIRERRTKALRALHERDRQIAATVPATARQLVQAGLFDRRAARAADSHRRAAGVLFEELRDRSAALEESSELTAAWTLAAILFTQSAR
jgi:superfamily II DNA or RNA helicase